MKSQTHNQVKTLFPETAVQDVPTFIPVKPLDMFHQTSRRFPAVFMVIKPVDLFLVVSVPKLTNITASHLNPKKPEHAT